MYKKQILIVIIGSLLIVLKATQLSYGQNKAAKPGTERETKIKGLIAAVEKNPNDVKAHEDYIDAMNIYTPAFEAQYALWLKRFTTSAVVPFELGKTYEEHHDPRCTEYLIKASKLDSTLAGPWEYLGYNATMGGDIPAAVAYLHRAVEADPKNPVLAFRYAFLFKDGDQAKYDSLMVNVAYRFPDSEKGAEALCQVAKASFNENEKIAYYEALYRMYAKQQSAWFRTGMADYYQYLLETTPDKAFDLALKMVLEIKINRGDWKQRLIVARQFVEAGKSIEANKPQEAADILNNIDFHNSKIDGTIIRGDEILALFKAKAADAGNKTQEAYDSLATRYGKQPTPRVYQAILGYALKLHVDSNKVDSDILKVLNKQAWNAGNFTLENLADHKQVSLSDYRGRIVFLTYWFPSCGPCREEFLHFEPILKKYKDKNIAYLAINTSEQQDNLVVPLVIKNGYSFVPLRNNRDKKPGNLPAPWSVGAPVNFLIDQQGRVIFSDFKITDKNEHTLELMLNELVKMGTVKKNETGYPN